MKGNFKVVAGCSVQWWELFDIVWIFVHLEFNCFEMNLNSFLTLQKKIRIVYLYL